MNFDLARLLMFFIAELRNSNGKSGAQSITPEWSQFRKRGKQHENIHP